MPSSTLSFKMISRIRHHHPTPAHKTFCFSTQVKRRFFYDGKSFHIHQGNDRCAHRGPPLATFFLASKLIRSPAAAAATAPSRDAPAAARSLADGRCRPLPRPPRHHRRDRRAVVARWDGPEGENHGMAARSLDLPIEAPTANTPLREVAHVPRAYPTLQNLNSLHPTCCSRCSISFLCLNPDGLYCFLASNNYIHRQKSHF